MQKNLQRKNHLSLEPNSMLKKFRGNTQLALFIIALPSILFFLIFKYVPLLGNVIVFEHYDVFKGVFHSQWVGLANFRQMFAYHEFYHVLDNTLILSVLNIVIGFPAPLVLALLLNEVRTMWFKRTAQTMLYLPHFLSWVIVAGLFIPILAPHGMVNDVMSAIGLPRINFVQDPRYFRGLIVSTAVWKDIGWGMILYLAAMAGINPNLYEAALMDGANRWRQMWYITLPALTPAIVVLFLLRIGHVLDQNVDQMLMFLNPLVRNVGDVVDTYVYRVGLLGGQYSYTTAIGIFKSLVGLILIVGVNRLSKKITGESIY